MRMIGVRGSAGRWKFVLLGRTAQRIFWPGVRVARKVEATPRCGWEGLAMDGLVRTS